MSEHKANFPVTTPMPSSRTWAVLPVPDSSCQSHHCSDLQSHFFPTFLLRFTIQVLTPRHCGLTLQFKNNWKCPYLSPVGQLPPFFFFFYNLSGEVPGFWGLADFPTVRILLMAQSWCTLPILSLYFLQVGNLIQRFS